MSSHSMKKVLDWLATEVSRTGTPEAYNAAQQVRLAQPEADARD